MKPCKRHPKTFCVCACKDWVKGELPTDLWLPKDAPFHLGGVDLGILDYTGMTTWYDTAKAAVTVKDEAWDISGVDFEASLVAAIEKEAEEARRHYETEMEAMLGLEYRGSSRCAQEDLAGVN